jgi:hypothetical protein
MAKKDEVKEEAVEEEVKETKAEAKAEEKAEAKTEEPAAETAETTEAEKPQGPSKMPDLREFAGMAKTLFGALKSGIKDIISDYKAKRTPEASNDDNVDTSEEKKSG